MQDSAVAPREKCAVIEGSRVGADGPYPVGARCAAPRRHTDICRLLESHHYEASYDGNVPGGTLTGLFYVLGGGAIGAVPAQFQLRPDLREKRLIFRSLPNLDGVVGLITPINVVYAFDPRRAISQYHDTVRH